MRSETTRLLAFTFAPMVLMLGFAISAFIMGAAAATICAVLTAAVFRFAWRRIGGLMGGRLIPAGPQGGQPADSIAAGSITAGRLH